MNGNRLIPFYNNWKFLKTDLNTTMGELEPQKLRFKPVELPHDWLIYNTKDLYQDGCGWYRKEFDLETGEIDDLGMDLSKRAMVQVGDTELIKARISRGERLVLRFDGVYMDSTVYVNGKKIGDWKYGYSTFDMDITPAVQAGRNLITVQVRHKSPNTRWYSGAGIYRKVFLKICPVVYLPLDGTYIHTEKTEDGFQLKAMTEVAGKIDSNVGCVYKLYKGEELVHDFGWRSAYNGKCVLKEVVENPALWDVEDPQCYRLAVELCRKGSTVVIDRQDITVGFRTLQFTTDKGLFLNGRYLKINGVCEHHDFGCLGSAFHAPAMKRKMLTLKKMGVNAIRTSHNMPDPALMDLADKLGMLIVSEAFDMWERPKTEFDYARFFKEWCTRDVFSWVLRDRNHPSLLMWSIGNEIYDTHADEHGQEITKRLRDAVRVHDYLCNAPISIGSNYMAWEGAQNCADILKTAGYNYGENCYEKHHAEHPDWVMYGSETASIVQSRGIYHFPFDQSVLSDEDEQCSALGNSCTSWGAKSWEKVITDHRDADYIWGQFIWTGFDYIGEPTPYHTKNSYFGQIDTAGFPKDAFYAFKAEWTDGKKDPFVHVFPYWDFNPGQLVDVRICSNAPMVELFVNGASQGKKAIDHAKGTELIPTWKVVYVPGSITAVAYDEAGNKVAEETRSSFGDSKKIVLEADKLSMVADTRDMAFVTISTVDEKGNPVENASDYVQVEVEGPGRVLGMDNGDSTDYDPYKTCVRKLFAGKLLVVIGSTDETGEITVKVSGKDLETAEIKLQTVAAAAGTFMKNRLEDCFEFEEELPERIPARKLELQAQSAMKLTPEQDSVEVKGVFFPAATTDREVEWKCVTAYGVEVNFAKVEEAGTDAEGNTVAKVTAWGDGEFYVRCMVKNDERAIIISQLECCAEGFGLANIDPYEFMSAALYSDSTGEIGNGNEKGIATARGEKSSVSYEKVDFGDYGSDEVTIPIFALDGNPYYFELWLGKPGEEGARKITTLKYEKPSIWNVYQEETFKLPERIRGLVTLTLTATEKVHIKGFTFARQEKAFGRLYAEEANTVYGDTFTRDGKVIRGIGNNVTIGFDNMNFGPIGVNTVTFCGRTPLALNTIHIIFTDENGSSTRRMVEFAGTGSSECTEQTFSIDRIAGKGKIELVFLPGCNFDLESIQFA